jgi:NADH-quinone oxidoreductase subunit M
MSTMLAATSGTLAFPILSMLIVVPAVGALIVLVLSKRRPEYMKLVATVTSVATGAMAIWLTAEFDRGAEGFQFVSRHPWIEQWGISWHLGVDGISLFLVLLTGVLFPLAIVGIDPHNDDPGRDKPYFAWLLLLGPA